MKIIEWVSKNLEPLVDFVVGISLALFFYMKQRFDSKKEHAKQTDELKQDHSEKTESINNHTTKEHEKTRDFLSQDVVKITTNTETTESNEIGYRLLLKYEIKFLKALDKCEQEGELITKSVLPPMNSLAHDPLNHHYYFPLRVKRALYNNKRRVFTTFEKLLGKGILERRSGYLNIMIEYVISSLGQDILDSLG